MRGTAEKVPVFALLKRGGTAYIQAITDADYSAKKKIKSDSIVYTDCYRSYNALDVSEFKHFRMNYSELFANKHNHINGIENFWNQAKRHLRKDNGVPKK